MFLVCAISLEVYQRVLQLCCDIRAWHSRADIAQSPTLHVGVPTSKRHRTVQPRISPCLLGEQVPISKIQKAANVVFDFSFFLVALFLLYINI